MKNKALIRYPEQLDFNVDQGNGEGHTVLIWKGHRRVDLLRAGQAVAISEPARRRQRDAFVAATCRRGEGSDVHTDTLRRQSDEGLDEY